MVASLRQLISPDNLTKGNVRTAVILGWCVEWVSKMSKLVGLIFFMSISTSLPSVEQKLFNELIFWAVIKRPGPGISLGYYECGPRLLSLENGRKVEPKKIPSCLIPHRLVDCIYAATGNLS